MQSAVYQDSEGFLFDYLVTIVLENKASGVDSDIPQADLNIIFFCLIFVLHHKTTFLISSPKKILVLPE
jgi:hypothetical protein